MIDDINSMIPPFDNISFDIRIGKITLQKYRTFIIWHIPHLHMAYGSLYL